MPTRIQLSRQRGFRLPPNTVSVARPTRWGNPYRVGDEQTAFHFGGPAAPVEIIHINTSADAVRAHRLWMEICLKQQPEIMRKALDELRGKNLACWCAIGAPCHADTLLDLANA